MARPKSPELTERELEIMHVFWDRGVKTAQEVRDELATRGRDLTYTTVATLVRILAEKGFVRQTNAERPYTYEPVRGFEEVSQSLVNHLVSRVFGGSLEIGRSPPPTQSPASSREQKERRWNGLRPRSRIAWRCALVG